MDGSPDEWKKNGSHARYQQGKTGISCKSGLFFYNEKKQLSRSNRMS